MALCRVSGRGCPDFAASTRASRWGPARPRAIGCEGAGGWLTASHERQETFSRTCSTTFHRRGSHSSVSVTSSPSLRTGPPHLGQAQGGGIDEALAGQILRQRAAGRLAGAATQWRDPLLECRDLGRRLLLGCTLLQLSKL